MRLKSLHSTEGGQGVRPQTASASHSARVVERRASVSADEVSLLIEESLNRIMANRAKQWIGRWKDIGLDPAQAQEWVTKNSATYTACHAAPH